MVKNLPSMQETWVPSLGQKCLLEKEMATHSSILAQRTLWDGKSHRQRNLVGCSPWGQKELDVTERLIWTELDCSPPSSSSHGILQARIVEWVAIPSSRGSSWSRDWTLVSCGSCIAGRFFTTEPPGKPYLPTGSTQIKEGLVFKLHHLSLLSKIIC